MIRNITVIALVVGLLSVSCTSTETGAEDKVLKIAIAANMQYPMDSITTVFTELTGITCEVTSNSSGMLTAQIQNGAPFDLFLSANMSYPEELIKSGFGDCISIYAYGKLALVYPIGTKYTSVEDLLLDSDIRRIAIPDERTAPYGIAAESFLRKIGIREKLTGKVVIGESVAQVNQYIETNAVNAAFTSYSYVHKFEQKHEVIQLDPTMYPEIEQGALILKSGKKNHPDESMTFIEFLSSEECRRILVHFGYNIK